MMIPPERNYSFTTFAGLAIFAAIFPTVGLPLLGAAVALTAANAADDAIYRVRLDRQRQLEWKNLNKTCRGSHEKTN
jgi:hypothetical protein